MQQTTRLGTLVFLFIFLIFSFLNFEKTLGWNFTHSLLSCLLIGALVFPIAPSEPKAVTVRIPPPSTQKKSQESSKSVAVSPIKQLSPESNTNQDTLSQSLKTQFLEMVDFDKQPVGSGDEPWTMVLNQTSSRADSQFAIQVHQKKGSDFTFRIVVDLDATPESAFDFLVDISNRPTWDEVCQTAGIVENVNAKTTIQYLTTKAFWPTAARDAIVISFVMPLETPKSFLNVTQSIPSHANYPTKNECVRMQAHIAGTLVKPHPTKTGTVCRVIQIMDGDMGGWLPKTIVSLVTTQAFPVSMKRANKLLMQREMKHVSEVIEASLSGKVKAVDTCQTVIKNPKTEKRASAWEMKNVLLYFKSSQPLIIFVLMFLLWRKK